MKIPMALTVRDPLGPCPLVTGGCQGQVGAELEHWPARHLCTYLSPLSAAPAAAWGGGCGRVTARLHIWGPEIPARPQKGQGTPILWTVTPRPSAGKAWGPSGNHSTKGHSTEAKPGWMGSVARCESVELTRYEPQTENRPGERKQNRPKPQNQWNREGPIDLQNARGLSVFEQGTTETSRVWRTL